MPSLHAKCQLLTNQTFLTLNISNKQDISKQKENNIVAMNQSWQARRILVTQQEKGDHTMLLFICQAYFVLKMTLKTMSIYILFVLIIHCCFSIPVYFNVTYPLSSFTLRVYLSQIIILYSYYFILLIEQKQIFNQIRKYIELFLQLQSL